MMVQVCVVLESIPGPFETPITIPLELKELVPKHYYGYYYYGDDEDRKRRESDGEEMLREVRSAPDNGKKPINPAGELI